MLQSIPNFLYTFPYLMVELITIATHISLISITAIVTTELTVILLYPLSTFVTLFIQRTCTRTAILTIVEHFRGFDIVADNVARFCRCLRWWRRGGCGWCVVATNVSVVSITAVVATQLTPFLAPPLGIVVAPLIQHPCTGCAILTLFDHFVGLTIITDGTWFFSRCRGC